MKPITYLTQRKVFRVHISLGVLSPSITQEASCRHGHGLSIFVCVTWHRIRVWQILSQPLRDLFLIYILLDKSFGSRGGLTQNHASAPTLILEAMFSVFEPQSLQLT